MTNNRTQPAKQPVVVERTWEADVQDLWDLWTTKDGFESWWGPEGFRVEVHEIDPRVGGKLSYDMIAVGAEQVAFMERAGQPTSHPAHGVFTEIDPPHKLTLRHMIDFLPGVEPYEHHMHVEFFVEGKNVRMVVTLEPYHNEEMTVMAKQGFESQLTKVPAVLEARRARRK